eukprot:CAMPEP_0194036888 /NCGR_PEP_ID=MMETSP0009_2-20130614/9255_1 /TAXON_ID=210454 /ORGANISM="Grammatophora oceanica, Strain CCMP 410" /LENGTH=53 /DNA_ID=CAMNT_0038678821 /DNA_START=69 /DNA_END=226 /DNA_ORIENTATION=-
MKFTMGLFLVACCVTMGRAVGNLRGCDCAFTMDDIEAKIGYSKIPVCSNTTIV